MSRLVAFFPTSRPSTDAFSFVLADYKFGEAKPGYEAEEDRFQFTQQHDDRPAEEITSLTHLAKWKIDGFKPVFLLDVKRGSVAACAVSDAGKSRSSDAFLFLSRRSF